MDPLSAVSGIAGTVAVGAKVLVALHGFAKGVKSAPEELKLLTRELEDLCKIMDNFRKKTKRKIVSQGIEDSLGAILDIFIQLNQLIIEHTVSEKDGFLKKGWKQAKWHYIEKDIGDLRAHLNSNKGNLLVALTLANELQNGHSNMKLERVQGTLEEVIERLQDRDMQTVATCESFALQRWQEVRSTIAPSSRPTTPNDQISAARSESGIVSETGFSERSIPMSAYQFNDMETRGKGVLISDGTQTKAYTLKAGKRKKDHDSKPPRAGVSRAGSPAGSSKPPTKSVRATPFASIPEPEEGDASTGVIIKAPPLRAPALAPVPPHKSPKLAMERFLQVLKPSENLTSGNPSRDLGDIREPSRKTYAIWPPYRPDVPVAGKSFSDDSVFLEVIDPPTLSRDDSFQLQADKRVRLVSYTDEEWFYGQVYPEGVVTQFRRAEFRHAPKPRDEEMRMEGEKQMLALLRPGKSTRVGVLEDGLGIGGNHTSKKTVGEVVIPPPAALMEVISVG